MIATLMQKFTCVYFLSLIFSFSQVQGQSYTERTNYWSVGFQLNAMNYFGDLNPQTDFASTEISLTRPGFGLQAEYKFHPNFRIRFGAIAGRLQGDDFVSANPDNPNTIYRYARNLHFRNDILEVSSIFIFDLLSNKERFYNERSFVPYLFGGVGVFYHNPKAKVPLASAIQPGEWVSLQPLGTEGQGRAGFRNKYSKVQVSFPVGIGFRIHVSPRVNLSIESGMRITMTDYLDDVSGEYAGYEILGDDLARIMSDRSGELNAALGSETRNSTALDTQFGPVTTTNTSDGNTYTHYNGYGDAGEIRGKSSHDFFFMSGFSFNYIISVKRYRPIKR